MTNAQRDNPAFKTGRQDYRWDLLWLERRAALTDPMRPGETASTCVIRRTVAVTDMFRIEVAYETHAQST